MIKLKNILYEILNNFSIEVDLFVDKSTSHYDLTNEIRALKGITIVNIITPEGYSQTGGDEYIRLRIKFVTRGDANEMLQEFLNDALAQGDDDEIRIQGIKSMKFREGTLKQL